MDIVLLFLLSHEQSNHKTIQSIVNRKKYASIAFNYVYNYINLFLIKGFHMNKLILIIISILAVIGVSFFIFKKQGTITTEIRNSEQKQAETAVQKPIVQEITGTPLVTMNGKTLISVESLKAEKEKIFAANPQLQKLSAYMGEKELERNLLQGLTAQYVMKEYIQKNRIDQTQEYQSELNAALQDVERMINTKFFTQKLNTQVSDSDIKKFYEENKNMIPNAIISRGGIMTKEVTVDTEAEAKNLVEKVRIKKFSLEQAVKEIGIAENKIKDLKLVNDQSVGIDNNLKTSILKATVFPDVSMVKTADSKYSVFVVTTKEEAKYQPLNDQIKNDIKAYLEREKQAEVMDKEIETLKASYGIIVNDSYFGPINQNETKELTPEIMDLLEQEDDGNVANTGEFAA